MAASYISVPRDLTKVKSKVMFNLTKRQLICFGMAVLIGVPSFFLMKTVMKAFETAGLSANDYMEQVTSFSASLLNSLKGDTAKAATVADQAMVDMADNANKFGTDIGSIQNAYQGFAKQNYTMLDS